MPGVPQTLPVPPLVNEMTMLNAIRLAAGSGGGGGGTGNVVGPAFSTNNAVPLWDGVTGKLLKDSSIFITGGGTLALDGFTLTVPATGTAALIGAANVFTQPQTIPGVELSSGSPITNGIIWDGATIGLNIAGTTYAVLFGAGRQFILVSDMGLCWSSTGSYSGTRDTCISRGGVGILAQRFSTQAQISQIYGTYTDDSNYERLSFITAAGAYSIKPEASGTGTLRTLQISGLPTSSAGLPSGTLWNNLGIVNVA